MDKDLIKSFFDNNLKNITITCNTEDDTKELGYEFAKYLHIEDIVVLTGELGSGKTVFVNGFAKYYGVENEVSSPTFTIVNEYNGKNNTTIYHFDTYRLKDEYDFENTIGLDYFSNGISLIEWGEIIKNILPKKTIYINIIKKENSLREFNISREV